MFEDRGPGWEQLPASPEDLDLVEEALNTAQREGLVSGSDFNRIYFNIRAAETLGDLEACLQRIPTPQAE